MTSVQDIVSGLREGTWKPTRVMIDEHEGRPAGSHRFDVVFVRNDGWTLGAPFEFEAAARKTWQKEWLSLIRRTECGWVIEHPRSTPTCKYGLAAIPDDVLLVQDFPDRFDEVKKDPRPKWSGNGPIPGRGDRVRIRMNQLDAGVVEAYFVEHGWLGVQVRLDPETEPEWHKRQCAGTWTEGKALVFGIEIEREAALQEDRC